MSIRIATVCVWGWGALSGWGLWGILSPIRDLWLAENSTGTWEEVIWSCEGRVRLTPRDVICRICRGHMAPIPDPSMMEMIYYYIVI